MTADPIYDLAAALVGGLLRSSSGASQQSASEPGGRTTVVEPASCMAELANRPLSHACKTSSVRGGSGSDADQCP